MNNIQIPEELYCQLYLYFSDEDFQTEERYKYIQEALEEKYQKMKKRFEYKKNLQKEQSKKEA